MRLARERAAREHATGRGSKSQGLTDNNDQPSAPPYPEQGACKGASQGAEESGKQPPVPIAE